MRNYKLLKSQFFSTKSYRLVPIRFEDRYKIMAWRNEQVYHLRQKNILSEADQDLYFDSIVEELFKMENPNQLLFSLLNNNICVGYGGLVHINWTDLNAEISFIMETSRERTEFDQLWEIFLSLIERVAFDELSLHKLYTYAYDLRINLYDILEQSGYNMEARLRDHVLIDDSYCDVVIHSKVNGNFKFIEKSAKAIPYGNILVSCASKKVGLVKAVKAAAMCISRDIKVYAGDVNPEALSRHFADAFYLMPEIIEENKQEILEWLRIERIKAVLPSRDGELLFWSNWKEELLSNGISVMVSDAKSVENCLDKFKFSTNCLSLQIPAIPTYLSAEEVDSELMVVKERFGAGSLSMALKVNCRQANEHAKTLENPIFQPYKMGREISVDAYITKSGQVKGLITRYRKLVENGESVVTETFYSSPLNQELTTYIEKLNLYGHIILQLFIDDMNHQIHLIECNARFGGASTLSVKAGLNSLYWFIQEAHGVDVENFPFQVLSQKLTQLRYPQDAIIYGDHI